MLSLGGEDGAGKLPWDATVELLAESESNQHLLEDKGNSFRVWMQTIGLAGPSYKDGQMQVLTFASKLIH